MKKLLIISLLFTLFTPLFAGDFEKLRKDIAKSVPFSGKNDDIRVLDCVKFSDSNNRKDLSRIKECMDLRAKNALYYIQQYQILYNLISKKKSKYNEELLNLLTGDNAWDSSIIIEGFSTIPSDIYSRKEGKVFADIGNDSYLKSLAAKFVNLPLLSLAAIFHNEEALQIIYDNDEENFKEEDVLFSLQNLVDSGSNSFEILYNFAKKEGLITKPLQEHLIYSSMKATLDGSFLDKAPKKNVRNINALMVLLKDYDGTMGELFDNIITNYGGELIHNDVLQKGYFNRFVRISAPVKSSSLADICSFLETSFNYLPNDDELFVDIFALLVDKDDKRVGLRDGKMMFGAQDIIKEKCKFEDSSIPTRVKYATYERAQIYKAKYGLPELN